jgi:hypothetical protein
VAGATAAAVVVKCPDTAIRDRCDLAVVATAMARARATIKGIPTVSVRMADAIVAGGRSGREGSEFKTGEVSQFHRKQKKSLSSKTTFTGCNSPTVNFLTLNFEL